MSTRSTKLRPRRAEGVNAGGSNVVQDLLVQVRQLKVENERLRLEAREAKERWGKPDPRLRSLDAENQRLRAELEAAREERDALRQGVSEAVSTVSRTLTKTSRRPAGRRRA